MAQYTFEDLMRLTPDHYLAGGYADGDGQPRPELRSLYATAASTQFADAELSPQELSLTAEAVRQIVKLHDGTPAERARETVDEALGVVAHAIRQPNNKVLARWLKQCAGQVSSAVDLEGLLMHLLAVERQYCFVAELSPQASPPLLQPAV